VEAGEVTQQLVAPEGHSLRISVECAIDGWRVRICEDAAMPLLLTRGSRERCMDHAGRLTNFLQRNGWRVDARREGPQATPGAAIGEVLFS